LIETAVPAVPAELGAADEVAGAALGGAAVGVGVAALDEQAARSMAMAMTRPAPARRDGSGRSTVGPPR
jgi:hypothetical protein